MDTVIIYPLKFRFILILAAVSLFVFSCKKDPVKPAPGPGTNTEELNNELINKWVIDTMRKDYLWIEDLPIDNQLSFTDSPEPFFYGLLSSRDRFSWIQNAQELNNELSGVIKTSGMGLGLVYLYTDGDEVMASVRYVLKNTPAASAGIKRGDLFTKVNGQQLMADANNNVPLADVLFGNNPFSIQLVKIEGNQLVNDREVTLTPIEGYQEPAVLLNTILETNSGKKVAYLFYNRFLPDPDELLAAFGTFKAANADELILDLRYNGGGSIGVAGLLAGLIQADFNENDVFVQYQYNSLYYNDEDTYKSLLGTVYINEVKNKNINLPRVFILATGSSASASELVQNNLKPFLGDANVIHIGSTTYGKNVGSYTIEIDPKNDPQQIEWGIQPIIVQLANKNGFGDYGAGFTPAAENQVNEWDELPWKPLGSPEDPFIARALAIIDPSMNIRSGLKTKAAPQPKIASDRVVKGFEDPINKAVPVHLDDAVIKRMKLK